SQLAIAATTLALIIVAVLILRILRRNLTPLANLQDAIHRLANGDYSRRVPVAKHDELKALTNAFNAMTDQFEDAQKSSQSLADIDRLILSSADLESVLRKVLISAQLDAVEITLILRPDMDSVLLATYRLKKQQLVKDTIGLLEITDDSLRDIDGYCEIAKRVCGENILEYLPIAGEGKILGVLVAAGDRSLTGGESKYLTDLADRLSVAVTNISRSDSLYQQAHFDALTGLINRHAFEDKLRESLSRSWRGEKGVLLFMDLDGFKKVNDTEGHKAGDRLLVIISDRLRETLREVDVIARLGGDEFAMIVPGCEDDKSVSVLCERIIKSITKPVIVDRMEHSIGASIGVAIFPDDGKKVEELIMKADSAMYRAKESGGSRFAFFDDTLNEANRHRVFVESRLRNAIKAGDLEVHFQPKLKLADRTVETAEALLRWTDAKLGVVVPDVFVPIAEETSLIYDFMSILVDKTANLFASAELQKITLDTVAINISQKQLMADGFALSLLSLLDRRNLPHHHIEIEVTESVFAKDTQQVVRELEILRQAGMKIALDDFGTGFSSLNMLRELPLDVVKIDRSFITELESSDQARILVQHLISIAATLGKEVVAEGVETEVQLQHLMDAKCDYVQGFLVSKAKPEDEFVRMLSLWQGGEASPNLENVS
ncbi:MAG: EAL domain-containing protein, partial [Gammaproteobacteria bacterium]|nr:EAL domain-containing protein [Gammaproteobacteria bacterium]